MTWQGVLNGLKALVDSAPSAVFWSHPEERPEVTTKRFLTNVRVVIGEHGLAAATLDTNVAMARFVSEEAAGYVLIVSNGKRRPLKKNWQRITQHLGAPDSPVADRDNSLVFVWRLHGPRPADTPSAWRSGLR